MYGWTWTWTKGKGRVVGQGLKCICIPETHPTFCAPFYYVQIRSLLSLSHSLSFSRSGAPNQPYVVWWWWDGWCGVVWCSGVVCVVCVVARPYFLTCCVFSLGHRRILLN